MKDCAPPYREKANQWLISVGTRIMTYLRRQRRAGSKSAAALTAALTASMLGWEIDWPHDYWTSWTGRGVLVSLTLLAGTGTLFVVFGLQKLLDQDKKLDTLTEAAEGLATLIEEQTSMRREQFGVNIWVVKGMLGFRLLTRGPCVTVPHSETPIVWTKGKGVIGQAWKRKRPRYADLDTVRANYPTGCLVSAGPRRPIPT